MKNLVTNLLFNLLVIAIIMTAMFYVAGLGGALFLGALLFLAQFVPHQEAPKGALRNEVIRTIYSSDVQKQLFPNNSFYKGAQVDQGITTEATTVDIPQDEDGESEVVVNPKKFPLEVIEEEDTKKSYSVDLLATKPQRIGDFNAMVVSYDKRAAKQRKHVLSLNKQIADRINYNWCPTVADYIRQTTSATVRAAKAPGATGNRKRIAKADIFWGFSLFNDLDIPVSGDPEMPGERRLLIPAYMYEDLLMIDEFISSEKLRMRGDLNAGQIGEILGFKVYMRSKTTVWTEDATPVAKAPGAAAAATDNQSALFYHTGFVRYAEGNVEAYINPKRGEYLGTTMNFAVRSGGTLSRNSQRGVAALVEDNE